MVYESYSPTAGHAAFNACKVNRPAEVGVTVLFARHSASLPHGHYILQKASRAITTYRTNACNHVSPRRVLPGAHSRGDSSSAGPAGPLLAVLQCCADDLRSLFSITRVHSRLHKAVAVLDSFRIPVPFKASAWDRVCHQQQVNCALLYLGEHGQHVRSLSVTSDIWFTDQPSIRQLPPGLHLTSLQLNGVRLQLQPGRGVQGVLGAAAGLAALKQLRLSWCKLLDRGDGLAAMLAALMQLPSGLEHLSMNDVRHRNLYDRRWFPTAALQHLQQLTCLELSLIEPEGPSQAQPALQPLQALTRLVDLSVHLCIVASIGPTHSFTASMLSA